ncbi:MAG TPA: ATP-binding protein [Vicinamibacterales bacterium]|nr:ATP-binding protein [Vicinamibacterales bacterium]
MDLENRRMALLLEEAQRLMAERDPAALLRQVCTAARPLTQASFVAVGIVDDDGAVDQFVAVGLDDAVVDELRQLLAANREHPARASFVSREIVRGVNPSGDPVAICLPASHPPVHSYVFVPVASPSHVYGWLALVEKEGAGVFSDEDTQVASTLGAMAGMAYENARLVAQLQAQTDELREHEEQTDFAMTAARSGVSYRNLDSSLVELSPSTAQLFGFPSGVRRVSQEQLYERVHPDDGPLIRSAVQRAIDERGEFALEFRLVVSEDGPRWFQFRGRVVTNEDGEPARVVGVITDVTERRLLELQLRQSQKMEALGQLAGGVAHDFNNLLTAIMGYGRFALERAGDAAQRHDLEEIVKAAGRAASLTKQLLAFSRRHMVETVVLDLNALIVDMVTMLRRMIGEDIELATTLASGLSHVRADRSQLEQVVMNLVINARDACGAGGRIRLVTEAVDVDSALAAQTPGLNRGGYVTLSVIDNGIGMNEETKSKLFEPFFTTKPRGQGTGLGLATVYGIVVQSGGAIRVESEADQGSTFTVYLPREQEIAPSAGRAIESMVATSSGKVLLVEDEQAVRELVRIILERAGHRVFEAATPEEALARFNVIESVDLLLTDVVMPAMSGFELFHVLVELQPSLRVLFISGYTDYATFEPTIADKGAAFLEKPFSAEALIGKVREVLGH